MPVRSTAVDLFSGAGGTTRGLRDAGFRVVAAVENDPSAAESFRANHRRSVRLLEADIRDVDPADLARELDRGGFEALDLLTACPPCQPFSTLGTGDADDPRNALIDSILPFVEDLRPRAILLENVPGLASDSRMVELLRRLQDDYRTRSYIVQASDFGVPQRRRRMIVLGLRRDLAIEPPADLLASLPRRFDVSPKSAWEAIAPVFDLDVSEDPLHRGRRLRAEAVARLEAVGVGGDRRNLPAHLVLDCHRRTGDKVATTIYGRLVPDEPAPTMTTRCTSPSCGRFGHPYSPRGLTLREAALLQSFPPRYRFEGNYGAIERQIGNAVPPRLAQALGVVVKRLLRMSASATLAEVG